MKLEQQFKHLFPRAAMTVYSTGGKLQEGANPREIYELQMLDHLMLFNVYSGLPKKPEEDSHYLFVIPVEDPRIYCMKEPHNNIKGHTSIPAALSLRLEVYYAGRILFRNGEIAKWTNHSGHYQPETALYQNNLLPMHRRILKPTLFKGMFTWI